jgi:4-methyl-5(b-hydroxyethyl)-thiazole monophosphate biosynthesis
MSKILVPIAKGFEEIEAVSIIDVCRRAGIEVVVAGVDAELIEGANGMVLKSDCLIDSVSSDDIDMVVLPGGWDGTRVLAHDERVQNLLKEMKTKSKLIGAICAAPYALHKADVLNQNFTCYPSVEEQIRIDGYSSDSKVVIDDNVITSRGPATAICFALEIVKILVGDETYIQLKGGLLADFC